MTTSQSELQAQSKRLVRGISFQQKLAILRQLEAGVSRKEICENFQCCQSTISRVLVTKHAILDLAEQDKKLNRQRVGMVTYKDIDEALSKWAQEMKSTNQMITSGLAKQKAEEIAREMGEEDFMPSAGWLYKWKERENVQFCKKSKVGDQLIDSRGSEEILKGLLEKHERSEDEYPHRNKKMKALEEYNQTESENYEKDEQALQLKKSNAYKEQHTSELHENYRLTNEDSLLTPEKDERLLPGANKTRSHCTSLDLNSPENRMESSLSRANPECNIATTSAPSTPATTSSSQSATVTPRSEPKKVLYSYDPVYVLTSTGRYRKEKTFLTLLQKLEILHRLKNGEKRFELINEYRLSQSAMCQIIADEEKIMKMAAIGQNLQMKRIRGGIFKAGESELNTWVLAKMKRGETLTRNQVKNKAKEIADRMKIEFKASTGWLEKWKARMNMDFNEKQILYRKKPQYISKPELEEVPQTSRTRRSYHNHEVTYGEEEDDDDDALIPSNNQHHFQRDLNETDNYHMDCTVDNSIDIKPFSDSHEQYYPAEVVTVVEDGPEQEKDVKPFINSPPHILPDEDSSSSSGSEDELPLHQQIIGWLNKYNIAPTAATELLTILHPVISDKPDAPHQTRLTITTKPASRSKGRPYAQHTYS